MMNVRRKKLVITIVVLLAVAAVGVFSWQPIRGAVCFVFLSPTEKKAVGEWTYISIGGPVVMTIRPDHTWTSIGGCLKPDIPINGRWVVDGSDLIYSVDLPVLDGEPPLQPQRVPIHDLIDGDRKAHEWLARNKEK